MRPTSILERYSALEKVLMVPLQIVPKGHKVLSIIGKVRQFIVGQSRHFRTSTEVLFIVFHGIDEEANGLGGKFHDRNPPA